MLNVNLCTILCIFPSIELLAMSCYHSPPIASQGTSHYVTGYNVSISQLQDKFMTILKPYLIASCKYNLNVLFFPRCGVTPYTHPPVSPTPPDLVRSTLLLKQLHATQVAFRSIIVSKPLKLIFTIVNYLTNMIRLKT